MLVVVGGGDDYFVDVADSAVSVEQLVFAGVDVVDDGFGHGCFYYCHVDGQTGIWSCYYCDHLSYHYQHCWAQMHGSHDQQTAMIGLLDYCYCVIEDIAVAVVAHLN